MMPRVRLRRGGLLVFAAISVAAVALLFPTCASVYLVERAGHMLEGSPVAQPLCQDAERALRRALVWQPQNSQAYWLLARCYESQGNGPATISALVPYLALRPRDPRAHWMFAEVCADSSPQSLSAMPGQVCGADEVERQAVLVHHWLAAGQTAAGFVRAGDSYRRTKDWTQAALYYQRAVLLDKTSAAAWSALAETYESLNRPEEAFESYDRVIALAADAELLASAHSSRGAILAGAGRWAEASAELAKAVALAPDQGPYRLSHGWYLYQARLDPELARAELTKASDLMPRSPWPHVRLAMIDFAQTNYTGAVEQAEQAIQAQPELAWGWMWRGKSLHRLGRLAEAEESLRKAVSLAPNQAVLHAELAYLLLDQQSQVEAIGELERAVALAPEEISYALRLADAYRASGWIPRAVGMYRRVLSLDPQNSDARRALLELEP